MYSPDSSADAPPASPVQELSLDHTRTQSAPLITPPFHTQSFPQSTPPSETLGAKDDEDKDHTRAHYNMFLERDLDYRTNVKMSDFCIHLLHTSTGNKPECFDFNVNDASKALAREYNSSFEKYAPPVNSTLAREIVSSVKFEELKNKYAEQTTERPRYEPFVNLVNYVLERLRGRSDLQDGDLLFARNDPQFLRGFGGEDATDKGNRSPDVVGVWKETMDIADGETVKRSGAWGTKGPDLQPFHFKELLFFVEFESEKRQNKEYKTLPYVSKTGSAVESAPLASTSGSSASLISRAGKRRALDAEPDTSEASALKRVRASGVRTVRSIRSTQSGASSSASPSPGQGYQDIPLQGDSYQLKCADYASGLFTFGGLRNFTFGFLLNGNNLQLCRYGRAHIISTERFNFLAEPVHFVAIIEGFMRMGPEQLGFNTILDMSAASVVGDMFRGAALTLRVDGQAMTITFNRKLYLQQALIGRGSFVALSAPLQLPKAWVTKLQLLRSITLGKTRDCSCITIPKMQVVVKFNSIPPTRTPEYIFINHAAEVANKDGGRDLYMLLFLPTAFHSQTFQKLDEPGLRSAFLLASYGNKLSKEIRNSNVLVLEELFPVTQIDNPYELARVWLDYIRCHKWLVKECRILHRDISLANLMFRVIIVDGVERKYGVINDFDLAIFFQDQKRPRTHKQRTGTQPFMAMELLQEGFILHYSRHDLESFFYCFYWHATGYENGFEPDRHPLRGWIPLSRQDLYAEKAKFWKKHVISTTSTFTPLKDMLSLLYKLIRNGQRSFDDIVVDNPAPEDLPPYNLKTLDGHVTHDKFIKHLQDALVQLEPAAKNDGVFVQDPFTIYDDGNNDFDEADPENDQLLLAMLKAEQDQSVRAQNNRVYIVRK